MNIVLVVRPYDKMFVHVNWGLMSILMIWNDTGGKIFKATSFTENFPTTASEIFTVSFLRIFFCFFWEIFFTTSQMFNVEIFWNFDTVCRKIFSAFYLILLETFSNSYGFPLMQEFNPVYPHLVLNDRNYFCSVLTDLSNLCFIKNSLC